MSRNRFDLQPLFSSGKFSSCPRVLSASWRRGVYVLRGENPICHPNLFHFHDGGTLLKSRDGSSAFTLAHKPSDRRALLKRFTFTMRGIR